MGVISGTPAAGTGGVSYTVLLTATNSAGPGTATLTLAISASGNGAGGVPVVTSPSSATGQAGQVFNYPVTASNNPTGYQATGLPAWLTIDPVAGLITGIPAAAQVGTYTISVSASNSAGSGSAPVTITITNAGSGPVSSGMTLWLEGDTGIQTQTVNGVSTAVWPDQSGLGNNATQTVASQTPTVTTGAINSHSVVHFSAASQQLLELPLSLIHI